MPFLYFDDVPLPVTVADKIADRMNKADSRSFLTNFRRYCSINNLMNVYNAVYELCCSKNIKKTLVYNL